MYPLVRIGPFRLSSGGLLMLIGVMIAGWLLTRVARARGGAELAAQADRIFYPAVVGAVVGGRLWYGLFNWDLYGRTPRLFWALQVADFSWPGALLGGMLVAYLWCRLRGLDALALADSAALALPVGQAIAGVAALLSGEGFGVPTALPWAVPLLGAMRHPTQIYFALAALLNLAVLSRIARGPLPKGTLMAAFLGLHGLTLLLLEALRADSLVLQGGVRAAQVFGLTLLLFALFWLRRQSLFAEPRPAIAVEAREPGRETPGHATS